MRIIYFLILSCFCGQLGLASENEADLNNRMSKLKLLQERVKQECIDNKDASNYKITIEKQTFNCQQLIHFTDLLAQKLQADMEKFKMICEEKSKNTEHGQLAMQAADLAKKSVSCTPSPDQKQCFSKFYCGMLDAFTPMKLTMGLAAKALNSETLKQCSTQNLGAPACLVNILRGIFDSIWSNLKFVWDIGKAATVKSGEMLGIIKKSEALTSEKAMLAQQASPSFLKQLMKDPKGVISAITKNLYQSLEDSAINHYGCEKWSGLPFNSSCLQPMTTWKCGSCQQKAQVYCGIAGYAVGEIGTAFLTGGMTAGGKAAFKGAVELGSGPARNVAAFIGKTFPKSAAEILTAANELKIMAKLTYTASESALLATWKTMKNNKVALIIAEAAAKTSVSLVGKAAHIALRPAEVYLRAMDQAFIAGHRLVEKGLTSGEQVVTTHALNGAKIADEAMGAEAHTAVAPALFLTTSEVAPTLTAEIIPTVESKLASATTETKATQKALRKVAQTEEKAIENEAMKMINETKNSPELIIKYSQDPDYSSLFKAPQHYQGQDRDIAIIINDMEKNGGQMSKAEIKQEVERYINTCAR